jgi:hypothetical protein
MGERIRALFSRFFTKSAQLAPRTEADHLPRIRLLRRDRQHVVDYRETANGLEIAGERLTVACIERSDELFRGAVGDFLDLF